MSNSSDVFDPSNVDLDTADPTQIICYLNSSGNDYDGRMGVRVSALFVILICSTLTTLLPVVSSRGVKWLRLPLYGYLFARYFGAGVIVATAFIHLLDPAYSEIGPQTCVGMTGNWASYSWPPAIALASAMILFLLDFLAELYVEEKYGVAGDAHANTEVIITNPSAAAANADSANGIEGLPVQNASRSDAEAAVEKKMTGEDWSSVPDSMVTERAFQEQITAFLILEFGVIFHSVIIGLNLAVAGDEFNTLYPVLVFHQSFEGLGIGARLSVIPFPPRLRYLPYALCLGYGLTTPISIAIGLGLSTTYQPGSFTANIVSGVFDSTSAGILIYTGLVELLARDFLFNPERTRDKRRIAFMLVSLFLGTGIMALLGKWA